MKANKLAYEFSSAKSSVRPVCTAPPKPKKQPQYEVLKW